MSRYLLDTNIISAAMRAPEGAVIDRLRNFESEGLYTTIIVAAELRFGAVKKASDKLARQVEELLSRLKVTPIEAPLDDVYARLRSDLEFRGTPIGDADLWIAAQALHDGSVLVTDNTREFGRVPGLKVENWLRS